MFADAAPQPAPNLAPQPAPTPAPHTPSRRLLDDERPLGFTDARLALIAVVCWAVAGAEMSLQPPAILLAALCLFSGVWGLLLLKAAVRDSARRGRHHWHPASSLRATLGLVLVVAACVSARAGVELWAFQSHPFSTALPSHVVTCVVRVDSLPVPDRFGGFRAHARLLHCVNQPVIRARMGVVVTGAAVASFRRAESITVRVVLRPVRPARVGVVGSGRVLGVVDRAEPGVFDAVPAVLRAFSAHALSERSGEAQALLRGMGLGDRAAFVSEDLRAFQRSSLAHLVVVSGLHTSIIVSAVAGLVPGRGVLKVGLSVLVLVCVVVVMGAGASVVRACVMSAVSLFAVWRGSGAQSGPGLAFAVVGMVVWDPWSAVSVGFALSVAATAGVIWPARWVSVAVGDWAYRVQFRVGGGVVWRGVRWVGVWGGGVVAVSVCAQLAVVPVLFVQGMSVPVFGVVANVLVAPCVAVVCLVALAVVVVAPLSAAGADWLAWVVEPLCWWVFFVARACGGGT